ncbi:retrovirus-related pol polyprotein from transposon TNT 1-94 [Tanacetum coccineum]
MAKKSVMKNNVVKGTGQRETRPVWNNAQRINQQKKFVPAAVLTRIGRIPVSTAKQCSLRASVSTSFIRPVNTATPKRSVNVSKSRPNAFHKSHSPTRRSFYKSTALNTRILHKKVDTVRINGVNTAGQIAVSVVKGKRGTDVKASAGCGNSQQALKNKGIFNSRCSRHMTGNKDFLTDYQEIDGGFVAFGRSTRGVIKREFSVVKTPQQNGVAERKNRTLIEAARTMLADSLLPTIFWAEVVNTACYVLNRVLVTKPHNKTPYELIIGRSPSISFLIPFGCPITILNTLDPLGKFDGKAEEGFLVGYFVNSKAFRVFNFETRKVKENLHVNFLENKLNVAG